MLTKEVMGLLALGILWLNAALVLAVAFKQLVRLLRTKRRFVAERARGDLVCGTVVGSSETVYALRTIHRMGRAMTTAGPRRILFTDSAQSFEVHAFEIEVGAEALSVAAADGARAEVWIDPVRAATQRDRVPTDESFDAVFDAASKFKGHTRTIELTVVGGDRVWVSGARDESELGPGDDRPLLVSMIDPIAWVSSRVRLVIAFIAGAATVLAAISALALYPPIFGVVSTIGGALGLAYFLGIQPLGVAVRDRIRTPARALLGGTWTAPT